MTRSILIIAALAIAVLAASCNKEKNREIFEDFEGEEGVYMIKLPPALFLAMIESEPGNDDLGNIEYVKLLFFDETKATSINTGDILTDIRDKFDTYGYELALQFSSSGSDVSAYLLEDESYVSDIMVVINGEQGLLGLGLSGKLDGKALMRFASEVDYNELGGLIDIDGFTL